MSLRLLAVLAALALSVPAIAAAAAKNGITPISPKSGATVDTGSRPVFKMKVRGKGSVWVHVCKSRRRNDDGVICNKEAILRAKRKKGRTYQVRAKYFDHGDFWLNSPGTYYWQAYRIDCTGNLGDCLREGPLVRVRVR